MAKTIFNPDDRARLIARLGSLSATAPARWGRFTPPQMVSHLISFIRIAVGDEPARVRPSVLSNRLVRWLIIYVIPWPRGAPTAPEMLARTPSSWDADVAALRELIERAAANGITGAWCPHPAFGDLSGRDWGAQIHRHVHHHLVQFGA